MRKKMQAIVLGYSHSGTSMLAGALSHLGVDMGVSLKPADPRNPDGFFEDLHFKSLCDRVYIRYYIHTLTGRCQGPIPLDLLRIGNYFKRKFASAIRERDSDANCWGAKEPTLIYFIPLMLPHLSNPVFFVTHRNRNAITKSFLNKMPTHRPLSSILHSCFSSLRRTHIRYFVLEMVRNMLHLIAVRNTPAVIEKSIQNCYECIDEYIPRHCRCDIRYEDALKDPAKTIQTLQQYLRIDPSADRIRNAISFIKPQLNHYC